MDKLIHEALKHYTIAKQTVIVEKELHHNSWHSDLHYKIVVGRKRYSARFINKSRSPHHAFGLLNETIMIEQIRFCNYLVDNQIPFMRVKPTSKNEPFISLKCDNNLLLFILFEWIEGIHITHCNEYFAGKFGRVARRIHDVSSDFHSDELIKKSHLHGYREFINKIRENIATAYISVKHLQMIEDYVMLIEHHIERSTIGNYKFIVQSDLNPLNILWDEQRSVKGIVDFESIGYVDRVEGLAWLVKWYSRTDGVHSHKMSSNVAAAFIEGYRATDILDDKDFERLRSLIWLSGCINWNFTKKTINILNRDPNLLEDHLQIYIKRGEGLLALLN
ncbi:phosphotransferase enzyme family protein [Bacillus sp. SCS-151]|uniref:phosphotransferase enzyme family protein n=1 Tax=Nanhaiella sioensis TaxID=3115293 RepID=UPI00397AAB2F